MRPLTSLLLAFPLTACSSCQGTSQPHVSWPSVAACATVVRDDILPTVQAVLVDPDPERGDSSQIGTRAVHELEQLAQKHGAEVIACLVDQAVRSFDVAAKDAAVERNPVPAEPPLTTRKRMGVRAVPDAAVASEPVRTLPSEPSTEALAAARGRDFLQRVAGTRVEGDAQ